MEIIRYLCWIIISSRDLQGTETLNLVVRLYDNCIDN